MNYRSSLILFICVLGAISGALGIGAQAAPLSMDAAAISAPKPSLAKKTGQGCGWDYPCPAIPDYGQRVYRRDGDIYIHNNYGPVNVYVHGRRHGEGAGWPPEARPCETGGEGGCGERTNCGGYPCDESCGALCWMRRFKRGYCGHGCRAYLEQSRIAAEGRAERREEDREERREEKREEREARDEYPRGCGHDGCPAPRYERPWREEARRWYERPHNEREPQDNLTPREPFAGPHYRGTCTGGGC